MDYSEYTYFLLNLVSFALLFAKRSQKYLNIERIEKLCLFIMAL